MGGTCPWFLHCVRLMVVLTFIWSNKMQTCTNCARGLSFNSRKSTEAKKTQWNKDYYQTKKFEILAQRKKTYSKHAEEFKIASKMNYDTNTEVGDFMCKI